MKGMGGLNSNMSDGIQTLGSKRWEKRSTNFFFWSNKKKQEGGQSSSMTNSSTDIQKDKRNKYYVHWYIGQYGRNQLGRKGTRKEGRSSSTHQKQRKSVDLRVDHTENRETIKHGKPKENLKFFQLPI